MRERRIVVKTGFWGVWPPVFRCDPLGGKQSRRGVLMRFGICHFRTLTITLIGAAILSIGPAWAEGQHDLAKASQTPAPFPAKLEKECRWHRVADGSVTLYFGLSDA